MENKENNLKEPRGFYVEKGSFFSHAAVTILILSMAARLLGTMKLWGGDMITLLVQVLLPVGSALLFIVFILLLGRVALWATILPVLGGAAFFILSVFDKTPAWTMFICIALAFLAAFLYTATLSGMIRTKWLVVLAFALIFAYQIVFRVIPVFRNTESPVSFTEGMTLLSSLGMVFAMLCASLAIRRKKSVKTEPELPKIKDPVVVMPQQNVGADITEAEGSGHSVLESVGEERKPGTDDMSAVTDIPAEEMIAETPKDDSEI